MTDGGEPTNPYAGIAWVPRRGVLAATLGLAGLLVVGATVAAVALHQLWLAPMATVAALAVGALAPRLLYRYPKVVVGGGEVDRRGIFLGGRHVVKRRSIQEARLEDDENGRWFVHVFVRFGGIVTLGVENKADGRALIDALELGAGSATSRFLLTRRSYSKAALVAPMLLPAVALLASPLLHLPMRIAAALFALAAAVSGLWTASRTVQLVIGADGLLLRDGLLRRPRFIGHDAIDDVSQERSDVVVRLRSDETLRFPMGFARKPDEPPPEKVVGMATALLRRIEEARAVYAGRGGEAPSLAALARSGRTTSEWLDALRRAGAEAEGGFRDALTGRDRLWALALGAKTPPHTRVTAAVALRVAADDETRARIAAIAASCASPEVAARIRIAAEGDDDEVLALLDQVEPRARRS